MNLAVLSGRNALKGLEFPNKAARVHAAHLRRYFFYGAIFPYAPHFISTVVMVSMLTIFLNKNYGIVNQLAGALGAERVAYLDSAETKVAQYLTYADPQQRWLTKSVLVDTQNAEIARLAYPDVSFTQEENEIINTFVDLDSYVDQMEARFITGETSIEQEYDGFIQRIQDMNVDRMIDVRQAAYDRWNAQ